MITNIRHFMDENGEVPDLPLEAKELLRLLTAIIEAATIEYESSLTLSAVTCRKLIVGNSALEKSKCGFMPKIIRLAGNVWNVEMKGLLVIGNGRPRIGVTIHGISEPFPDKANGGTLTKINKMAKIKRKLTAAHKRASKMAKAEEPNKYMWVFINGKQVKDKRPLTIGGISIDEVIQQNADPIWLHQNEMWEYMQADEDEELS
jgi:hypothetical protein